MRNCPNCGKGNVQERTGKNGTYLANVETYPNGKSYFRGLHTSEACKANSARRDLLNSYEAAKDQYQTDALAWFDAIEPLLEAHGKDSVEVRDFLATNPRPVSPVRPEGI